MAKNELFSRQEMKILVYNKVKRGMSYDDAVKELSAEVDSCRVVDINTKKKKKEEKKDFKTAFQMLKDGQ